MSESAQIIPFPTVTRPPAPVVETPQDPSARLKRALESLNAALAEQRQAVAQWRDAMVDLDGSVTGLGHSLRHLNDRLEVLKQQTTQRG